MWRLTISTASFPAIHVYKCVSLISAIFVMTYQTKLDIGETSSWEGSITLLISHTSPAGYLQLQHSHMLHKVFIQWCKCGGGTFIKQIHSPNPRQSSLNPTRWFKRVPSLFPFIRLPSIGCKTTNDITNRKVTIHEDILIDHCIEQYEGQVHILLFFLALFPISCTLEWFVNKVTAFLGYFGNFGNTRVCNAYLRIDCWAGGGKWSTLLFSLQTNKHTYTQTTIPQKQLFAYTPGALWTIQYLT